MTATTATQQREVRLDFFRGLAMFIILIAHMPGNRWTLFIPARFGPSDATEMFVFCSGFASAIAFGGVFIRRGFGLGLVRIVFRCWQIYWAHICLFLMTATVCILGNEYIAVKDYVSQLNLMPFFKDPISGFKHLLTLTYVPNYFDILPMYMVVLLMLPIVVALSRVHVLAAGAFCVGVWAANMAFDLRLSAEWWSNRQWFFDPLGWQLIFFTGFAFGSGWLRAPKPNRRLVIAALAFVVVLAPISYYKARLAFPQLHLQDMRDALQWGFQKTDFGLLRYVHFLALAYLMHCLFHSGREQILRGDWAKPIITVGQQALATFIASMVLARIIGMSLDVVGRDTFNVAVANLTGFAILIFVARLVAYFKSTPWKRRPVPEAPPPATVAIAPAERPARAGPRPAPIPATPAFGVASRAATTARAAKSG
ncbi:MAG: OpgC domain-containing protein [Gammaproteobacteria bacterium]